MPSFKIIQSPVSMAAALRARCFCCCISASNSTVFTVMPFSRRISSVRSSGKPNVSYSVKASLPLISVFPVAFVSAMVLSSKRIPVSKVRRNDSSSSLITFSINSF